MPRLEISRAERIVGNMCERLLAARWHVEVHIDRREPSYFRSGKLMLPAQLSIGMTATRQTWEQRLWVHYLATVPPCDRQTSRLANAELIYVSHPSTPRKLDTYRALKAAIDQMCDPDFVPETDQFMLHKLLERHHQEADAS